MARNVQVRYSFTGGETEHEFRTAGNLSTRSSNFLPDKRGYLRTYRGRKPVFIPAEPQLVNKMIVAAKTFTDIFGRERLVIVAANEIYSVDGEVFTKLFAYPVDIGLDNGNAHVTILEHNGNVIFLHGGFPPVKWNGDEPVNWVGVRDVPPAPEVHAFRVDQTTQLWGSDVNNDYCTNVWGADEATHAGVYEQYYPVPYLQSDLEPSDDPIDPEGHYKWKCCYQNANGALGRWSAEVSWRLPGTLGTSANQKAQRRLFPILEWKRPQDRGPTEVGTDIVAVWLCRTGDVAADPDAGAFFLQGIYPYTQNRTTDNKQGLSLAIDEDNFPPVNASFGCVFKDTVLLGGNRADPNSVYYSKPGYWEQFPVLNYHRADDHVTAVLPLSDRVVVVTRTTIEVLGFDATTGTFALARKDDRRGSELGRSLVVYKDNIFGLFTDGYGVFDGFQYKGVDSGQDELFGYIDKHNADRVRAFVDPRHGYYCSVNHGAITDNTTPGAGGSTLILHYDFARNAWFRINDTNVSCFWFKGDSIMSGGVGQIYLFDEGGSEAPVATLELAPTSFADSDSRAALIHKQIRAVYVYVGSTSIFEGRIKFYTDENLVYEVEEAPMIFRGSYTTTFQDTMMDPVWDEPEVKWESSEANWVSPRRFWVKIIDFGEPVNFYTLRTRIETPGSMYAEIAGIGYDLELDHTQAGMP